MGKGSSLWEHVQTAEDIQRIESFQKIYQKHLPHALAKRKKGAKIPRTIHFIWLGPKNFPEESVERVAKWVHLHPGWTFKFWTDIDREPPFEGMEKKFLQEFTLHSLPREYYLAANYGEKAKILAYEILIQEGGIYVDHDMIPCKELDSLNAQLDFYCGLEKLGPTILSSSVIPSTSLIATRPNHPILIEAAKWLKQHWDLLETSYPGQANHEVVNRVSRRSLWALAEGIDRGIDRRGNCDIVFPTPYFSASQKTPIAYAIHKHEALWSASKSNFEEILQKQCQQLLKKDRESLMLTLLLSGLSFLGCVFLLLYARRLSKRGAL